MKLAGITFVYNGISMDYCFIEAIKSLSEFCDHVFVLDAGSTDGTDLHILDLMNSVPNITFIRRTKEEWDNHVGKEKLSHFTNIAIKEAQKAGYDWIFYLQADEILHEDSYQSIKIAVNSGYSTGYLVRRINLWGNPNLMLNVFQSRKPCSEVILRLSSINYRAYDDAESLCGLADGSFIGDIRIYHMGFVRDRNVHAEKIRYMQGEVFKVGVDEKLNGMDVFDPYKWFDKEKDLVPIPEPLPELIQEWAKKRTYE